MLKHLIVEVRGEEIWNTEMEIYETDPTIAARLRFIKECPLSMMAMDIRPSELIVKEVS